MGNLYMWNALCTPFVININNIFFLLCLIVFFRIPFTVPDSCEKCTYACLEEDGKGQFSELLLRDDVHQSFLNKKQRVFVALAVKYFGR